MACGMKHPKVKKATKKAKPKKKKQVEGHPSIQQGNSYFLLDKRTDFGYAFCLCGVLSRNLFEIWRKEVNSNEEMGEHLYGIGDFSGVFFRVYSGDFEGRED